MKVSPHENLVRALNAVRWRIAYQRWASGTVRIGAIFAAFLFLAGLVRFAGFGLPPWNPVWAEVCAGLFAVCCIGLAQKSWPRFEEAAAELDRRAGTADRFRTGWELGQMKTRDAMQELAYAECVEFAKTGQFGRFFPVRWPRGFLGCIAPLASLAFLVWAGNLVATRQEAVRERGLEAVSSVVERLETLAREAERRADQDPVFGEMANQLRQGARDLKTDAQDPDSAQKAALRELSRLEQMVQALQSGGMPQQVEDLKKVAEALAGSAGFEEVARALEEGRFSDAARALSEMGAGPDAASAEKRIQEALERLAEQRARSETMNRLLQELERAGGQGAMEKLQRMLQQLAQGKQAGRPGPGGGSEKDLKELLSALQNLKYGNPAQGDGSGEGADRGEGGKGSGEGRSAVQVFGKSGRDAEGGGGATGLVGGERDLGTTATPFGGGAGDAGESGADLALSGQLGAGETLSSFLPSAGDDSKATRRYKELYEAMAPEAREAVMQESIPIGSRFFIQRYFELIRPR